MSVRIQLFRPKAKRRS